MYRVIKTGTGFYSVKILQENENGNEFICNDKFPLLASPGRYSVKENKIRLFKSKEAKTRFEKGLTEKGFVVVVHQYHADFSVFQNFINDFFRS